MIQTLSGSLRCPTAQVHRQHPLKARAVEGGITCAQSRPELLAVLGCHRGNAEKDSRQPADKKPIPSKKVGCPSELEVVVEGDTTTITERHDHFGHVPGDDEDSRRLSLASPVMDKIVEVCSSCTVVLHYICRTIDLLLAGMAHAGCGRRCS